MSAPHLPRRNVSAVFDILDANKDDHITREDFEEKAAQISTLFGLSGTATADEIHNRLVSWWDQLRTTFDRDDDGVVTRDEFVQAHASGDADPKSFYQQHVDRLVTVVARAVDEDGDGFIEEAEYMRLFSVAKLPEETVRNGFTAMDTDNEGRVSVEEFETAIAQLFLSTNSAEPGTTLLGQQD